MRKLLITVAFAGSTITGTAIAQSDAPDAHPGMAGRGMAQADTNHDGKISKDEYLAQAAQRFDRMDTNHDGMIDESERQAMRGWRGDRQQPPAPQSDPGQ